MCAAKCQCLMRKCPGCMPQLRMRSDQTSLTEELSRSSSGHGKKLRCYNYSLPFAVSVLFFFFPFFGAVGVVDSGKPTVSPKPLKRRYGAPMVWARTQPQRATSQGSLCFSGIHMTPSQEKLTFYWAQKVTFKQVPGE